jgi:hypothetical protein
MIGDQKYLENADVGWRAWKGKVGRRTMRTISREQTKPIH